MNFSPQTRPSTKHKTTRDQAQYFSVLVLNSRAITADTQLRYSQVNVLYHAYERKTFKAQKNKRLTIPFLNVRRVNSTSVLALLWENPLKRGLVFPQARV